MKILCEWHHANNNWKLAKKGLIWKRIKAKFMNCQWPELYLALWSPWLSKQSKLAKPKKNLSIWSASIIRKGCVTNQNKFRKAKNNSAVYASQKFRHSVLEIRTAGFKNSFWKEKCLLLVDRQVPKPPDPRRARGQKVKNETQPSKSTWPRLQLRDLQPPHQFQDLPEVHGKNVSRIYEHEGNR